MKRDNWPVGDYGVRPRGNQGECFYCRSERGTQHKKDCVIRQRSVIVRVTIEYPVLVPEDWSQKDIEFHRNESSLCSGDKFLQEMGSLAAYIDRHVEEEGGIGVCCGCSLIETAYVREATAEDELECGVRVEDCKS